VLAQDNNVKLGERPNQQGVCHTMALPFTLKSILMQKEEL
jgi:hypothetical protein